MNEERKKIVYLITKSNWGGAQRYVYDLATTLDSQKYEAVVITGGEGILVDRLKEKGLQVYTLKNLKRDISFFDEVSSFFKIWTIIRKEKPDVLHVNSSKAGALGTFIGRLSGVPLILFTAHGWAFNEDRPEWQKIIIKCIHYITVLFSHKTIAVSKSIKTQMRWPFAEKKIVIIHPGRTITDMRYKDDARGVLEMKVTDTTARLIDYHNDFWIGTIAELHPIKRLNRAIDSVSVLIKSFPNLRFVIIHDGEEKERLKQQVRDLGLEQHVFFTGEVEEAARFLSAFDVFVLPSKSEAFGYVLIEAGQAHVPVVATAVGGVTDVITHNENGLLVPPDDTPALTAALHTLIENETLRNEIAHKHFERSKEFTVEKMVAETVSLYETSTP